MPSSPLLMLALQAAAPASPAPDPTRSEAPKVDFDLRHYKPSEAEACGNAAAPDGIVVCGRRPSTAYPLDRMAKIFEPGPMDAETGLFGTVRGRAYVEEVGMPGGQVSKRAMIGIKLPF